MLDEANCSMNNNPFIYETNAVKASSPSTYKVTYIMLCKITYQQITYQHTVLHLANVAHTTMITTFNIYL
jgi:hypothetical protein